MDDSQLSAIVTTLDQRFRVDTLWVFGSTASGRATAGSDLDLAVLFRAAPSIDERVELESELADLLGQPVDLIDLDRASPALAMQVLRSDKLLLDRNPSRRFAFTALLPSRYDDLRRLRAPIERAIAKRMTHGRT